MVKIELNSLNCLRLGGRFSQKSGWNHTGNAMDVNLLVLLEAGDCSFKIKGEVIDLNIGDVLLIPKDTWYQPCTQDGCSYLYFHFDGDAVCTKDTEGECGRAYRYCEPIPPTAQILGLPQKVAADLQTRAELSAALDDMLSDAPESSLRMHLHFFSALIRLCECERKERETPADRVKDYIFEHVFETLSLSEVALRFGYTKQHVIRIFKARFGMTPTDFIDRCRLEHGMLLLSKSDMTVEEVAHASGFEDANYFSRRFKKRFAVSPAAYRTRLMSAL